LSFANKECNKNRKYAKSIKHIQRITRWHNHEWSSRSKRDYWISYGVVIWLTILRSCYKVRENIETLPAFIFGSLFFIGIKDDTIWRSGLISDFCQFSIELYIYVPRLNILCHDLIREIMITFKTKFRIQFVWGDFKCLSATKEDNKAQDIDLVIVIIFVLISR
jgi:hypothetical protein